MKKSQFCGFNYQPPEYNYLVIKINPIF